MIVEALDRGVGFRRVLEHRADRFLGGGLAHTAGHTHDDRPAARPCGPRQIAQALKRVIDHDAPVATAPADQRGSSAVVQRLIDKVMPVKTVAFDGDEQRIGAQFAGIDGDRTKRGSGQPFGLPLRGGQNLVDREQCRHYSPLIASATTSWSEK